MPTPRLETTPAGRDGLAEAVALVREHGGVAQASRHCDIPEITLRRRYRRACDMGLAGGTLGTIPPGQIITGISTLYGEDGVAKGQWIKSKTERNEQQLLEAIEGAFERFKGYSVLPPAARDTDADLLTIYPRPDLHMGLYAWGEEAGEDFDLTIAEKQYTAAAEDLVACSPASGEALIIALGDVLHGDNARNATPESGHALDVDTRHEKVLLSAIWLEISNIQLALQRHSRVTYKCLKGNHDPVSAVAVSHAVHMFFYNDDRVTVDLCPRLHWYYRYGSCLVGAHHGHRSKLADLPLLMANHRPADWGDCRHRYYFSGHLHHVHTREHGGVFVEQLASPSAKDAWHSGGGYMGQRSMMAITLHRSKGERTRTKHVIG